MSANRPLPFACRSEAHAHVIQFWNAPVKVTYKFIAVELLLNGTAIENVQAFLGHASVRVTKRHYSPWVRARQERAEADVKRSWERDPLVQLYGLRRQLV